MDRSCEGVVAETIETLVTEDEPEEGHCGEWDIDPYGFEDGELSFYPPGHKLRRGSH